MNSSVLCVLWGKYYSLKPQYNPHLPSKTHTHTHTQAYTHTHTRAADVNVSSKIIDIQMCNNSFMHSTQHNTHSEKKKKNNTPNTKRKCNGKHIKYRSVMIQNGKKINTIVSLLLLSLLCCIKETLRGVLGETSHLGRSW